MNLIDLLYPPRCILCDSVIKSGKKIGFCSNNCAKIQSWDNAFDTLKYWFDDIICLWKYEGAVKSSLMRYKFYKRPSYHKTYSRLLCGKIIEKYGYDVFDLTTCVPLHRKRLHERGYNQAYLLSNQSAKILEIDSCPKILKRQRYTDIQSLLPIEKRSSNVENAFEIINNKQVIGKKILLFDDIITTGSTLDQCAMLLKQAGAKSVCAVVVASAKRVRGRFSDTIE